VIAHIQGKMISKTPAQVIIDCGGVGYALQISLHTYGMIKDSEQLKLHTHLSIKEDAHVLYGFAQEEERDLFLLLLTVNGVGTNTARMMLSSLNPADIRLAISSGNWALLKTIKGIGPKTAQRIVIDLQDKINKAGGTESITSMAFSQSKNVEEAISALVMLGFSRQEAEKGIQKIKQQNNDYSVEELVKNTLKIL
jgi:Holliday junction DNA helicase RuvA